MIGGGRRSRRGSTARRSDRADAAASARVETEPLAAAGAGVAGYRILRRIGSGSRADVFLAVAQRAEAVAGLADRPDGPASETAPLVVVRIYRDDVDDRSIACELEAMHAVPEAGLPALLDVATTATGARVAVVERIGGATVAQLIHERSLEPGEAVTLIAPVVAGIARLAAAGFVHARLAPSDVQLDAAGRPRPLGLGALERLPPDGAAATMLRRRGLEALTEYVEQVVGAVRPAGVFDVAVDLARVALTTRPFAPFERDLERALFGAAAPAPVAGLPPVRELRLPARVPAPRPIPQIEPTAPNASNAVGPGRRRRLRARGGLAAGLLDLAEIPAPTIERLAASADTDRVASARGRAAAWLAARRKPLVVGALIGGGALVLLLTAVPSAGAGPDEHAVAAAAADAAEPSATQPSASIDDPSAQPPPGGSEPPTAAGIASEDPIAGARSLLGLRASCFAELNPTCIATYVQSGSPLEDSDWNLMLAARDGAGEIRSYDLDRMEVVTEMGAAVLVQVAAVDDAKPASLLVVRSEAGWRLREIFD